MNTIIVLVTLVVQGGARSSLTCVGGVERRGGGGRVVRGAVVDPERVRAEHVDQTGDWLADEDERDQESKDVLGEPVSPIRNCVKSYTILFVLHSLITIRKLSRSETG